MEGIFGLIGKKVEDIRDSFPNKVLIKFEDGYILEIPKVKGIFVGRYDKILKEKFGIYENTKGLIQQKLKAPSTAEFQEFDENLVEKISDNEYKVNGYVDSENSVGAKIRSDWSCTVRIEGQGDDAKIKTNDIVIDENH